MISMDGRYSYEFNFTFKMKASLDEFEEMYLKMTVTFILVI